MLYLKQTIFISLLLAASNIMILTSSGFTFDIPTLVICITLIGVYHIVFLVTRSVWFKKIIQKLTQNKEPNMSPEILLSNVQRYIAQCFAELQIKPETIEEKEQIAYKFQYQNGFFILLLNRNTSIPMQLIYPGCISIPTDYIDILRIICNEINQQDTICQASYYFDQDDDREIPLHLTCKHFIPLTFSDFKRWLVTSAENCFSYNTSINQRWYSFYKDAVNSNIIDIEFHLRSQNELACIANETQMQYCIEKQGFCSEEIRGKVSLTINSLLKRTNLLYQAKITEMEITGSNIYLLYTDEAEIRKYTVMLPLLSEDGKQLSKPVKFTRKDAAIRIKALYNYEKTGIQFCRESTLYLMLHADTETNDTLYCKLTYTALPTEIGHTIKDSSFLSNKTSNICGNLMLGYSHQNKQQHDSEFEYMWNEAKELIQEGHADELSYEQRFIANITEEKEAQDLYWGNRLLRNRRYLEASILLERAWKQELDSFYKNTPKKNEQFYHTSHLCGLALFHLKLYKQALYYLQLSLEGADTFTYRKVFINCCLKCNDPRTLTILSKYKLECEEHINYLQQNENEIPHELKNFIRFLKRSLVQLYIQLDKNHKAQELCQKMINNNEDLDFALDRMTYIKKQLDSEQSHKDSKKEDNTDKP